MPFFQEKGIEPLCHSSQSFLWMASGNFPRSVITKNPEINLVILIEIIAAEVLIPFSVVDLGLFKEDLLWII